MITHHTDLLNALIEKYGLKSYLEIGVQNPANNFYKIHGNNLMYREGVDPDPKIPDRTIDESKMVCLGNEEADRFLRTACFDSILRYTSDDYFAKYVNDKWDLIFIDGLHTAEQVKRDFENSLRCLSDNGFIVIHDVLPENEEGTLVPRVTKKWWGDVYKFAMNLDCYSGIAYKTFNIDNGCCLVWKTAINPELKYGWVDFTWQDFCGIERSHLNVTDEVAI